MESRSSFEVPLDTLGQGLHDYRYRLDDGFFAAFPAALLQGGAFEVDLEVERLRNQFTFRIDAKGVATVQCDRCLGPFGLPLEVTDEVLVKFDTSTPREEEAVVFVPYGTERYDVSKMLYEAIGLNLPMSFRHADAGEECDPTITKYIAGVATPTDERTDDSPTDIPEDSPWSVLRDLGPRSN